MKKNSKKYLVVSSVMLGLVLAGLSGFAKTEAGDGDTLVLCPQGELYKCATIGMEGGGMITKKKGPGTVTIIAPDEP